MDKNTFERLRLDEFPPNTEYVRASTNLVDKFQTETHYSWYRILLIVRKYLHDNSGVFTLDEICKALLEHFNQKSKISIMNKLHNCITQSDIPFFTQLNTHTWIGHSDKYILREKYEETFTGEVSVPMNILKLQRNQYICYMKLISNQSIDPRTEPSLLANIKPLTLPRYDAKI